MPKIWKKKCFGQKAKFLFYVFNIKVFESVMKIKINVLVKKIDNISIRILILIFFILKSNINFVICNYFL